MRAKLMPKWINLTIIKQELPKTLIGVSLENADS